MSTDVHSKISLKAAELHKEYIVCEINSDDELKNFLFTLGCYEGEPITVVGINSGVYLITIKDARYSIDSFIAEEIMLINK